MRTTQELREAKAQGVKLGEARGEARRWTLNPQHYALIAQTESVALLQGWIVRAATQSSAEAVFAG
ncbi:MAG: hypothetical protein Q8Q09_24095 [Deltaproteobacteria bacterium]|nr:hypothetical protein [Deltaproteobacteria bacterium]